MQRLIVERKNLLEADAPGLDGRIEDVAQAHGKLAAAVVQTVDRVVVMDRGPRPWIQPETRGPRADVVGISEQPTVVTGAAADGTADGVQHLPPVERLTTNPFAPIRSASITLASLSDAETQPPPATGR